MVLCTRLHLQHGPWGLVLQLPSTTGAGATHQALPGPTGQGPGGGVNIGIDFIVMVDNNIVVVICDSNIVIANIIKNNIIVNMVDNNINDNIIPDINDNNFSIINITGPKGLGPRGPTRPFGPGGGVKGLEIYFNK